MKSLMAAAALAASFAAPASHAGGTLFDAVSLGGSRGMALRVLSEPGLPAEAAGVRDGIARSMGLAGDPGSLASTSLKVSPVLRWDDNVNGGMASDDLVIGGYRFLVDERFRARGGVVVGGAVSAGAAYALGERTGIEFGLQASAAFAPALSMTKTAVRGEACVRHVTADYGTLLSGCADVSARDQELGSSRKAGVEVSASRTFVGRAAVHEAEVTLRREKEFENGAVRDQVGLRYGAATPGGVAFSAEIGFGTASKDVMTTRRRAGVSAAAIIAGRPTRLGVSVQEGRGGLFLGEERREVTISAFASRQVTDRLTIGVHATRTRARHDFFDDSGFGVDFGIRF